MHAFLSKSAAPLLTEALKFVPKQSGHIRVSVSLLASRNRVYEPTAGGSEGASPMRPSSKIRGKGLVLTLPRCNVTRSTCVDGSPTNGSAGEPSCNSASVDGNISHRSFSNFKSALARVANRIFTPTVSVEGARVLPVNFSDAGVLEASVQEDPRLPFECHPNHASSHIVNIPDTLIAEPTVVTVSFRVSDNGVGLTSEQRARLFKPFSQVWIYSGMLRARFTGGAPRPLPSDQPPS